MSDAGSGPVLPRHGATLLEERVQLDPEPGSASVARHLLRDALNRAGREDWVPNAELAVSEVVTNATLHAHTSIQLWLGVFDDQVCVEVRDFNPAMPVQRHYDVQATTGRGLGLVATLAQSCGVHSLGDDGKVVWFCVGDAEPDLTADDLLAMWDIDGPAVREGDDCIDVMLPSMPATLWLSARQHHDAILRELVFYLAEHPELTADVASADWARYQISGAILAGLEEARASGTAEPALPYGHPSPLPWVPKQMDLTFSVPLDAAPKFAAVQDVLDLAEQLSVDGELLIRPGLPEIIAVRDWACEQVIAQLAGVAAAPWPGTDQERFEHEVHDRANAAPPLWDATVVTAATTGVIAADDANRILAISPPLAEALGWDPVDLVGRRVVSVIPPALREAHVAGFSRHLSTGEAHVLGVPLELPVLRRDGSEVQCSFVVERAPAVDGRTVYLAWIDPLGPDPAPS